MKLKPRKDNFYAFNINSTNSNKNKTPKDFTFKALTGNFYEDLINSDSRIKNSRQKLTKIKYNSIKESVYSNNIIPSSWKIMLDYQPTVYRAIDRDHSFAYYLGRSQNQNQNSRFPHSQQLKSVNDIQQSQGQKSMSSFIKKFFIEKKGVDDLEEGEKKSGRDSENFSVNDSKKDDEKGENKFIRKKSQIFVGKNIINTNDKNIVIDDKLISSKLDEYRTKYDLNKYMESVKRHKKKKKKKKKIFNIPPLQNLTDRENNYKQFLKTRTQNDKEKVLKSSIYYNLIAKHNTDTEKKSPKRKKISLKPIETENIYLFHNKEFDKVIKITNPKIKRDLELINYYGPMYTHCKFCNNRNLEFYKNSEPNQTLKLLQYLKKIKLGDGDEKEDKKI